MRYNLTPVRMATIKKSTKNKWKKKEKIIIHAGEGVEKGEPTYTVGGNLSWCSHYGKQGGVSSEN